MPSFSGCPRCHRVIQIHSLADAALELRCPYCAEAFAVHEIAASASTAPAFARPLNSDASSSTPDEEITEGVPWTQSGGALGFAAESRAKPRRGKPRGVLGPLIGVVLGGVVGISFGYIILIAIAGKSGGDVFHVLDRYPMLVKYLPGADR